MPQAKKLKQQKSFFSQFWRLEVQDQAASRLASGDTSLPGWQTTNCCFFAWPFLCADRGACLDAQSCLTLCNPTNFSMPDFPVLHHLPESYLTLCNPTNFSTPDFPVLHHLPEFAQAHVHRVGDAIQPPHPLERGVKRREWERLINWPVVSSSSCKDTNPIGLGPLSYDLI